jgi:hypothetical protein
MNMRINDSQNELLGILKKLFKFTKPEPEPEQKNEPKAEPKTEPAPAPEPLVKPLAGGGDDDDVDDISIMLDPELDDNMLKKYIDSARKIIMTMYIFCEKDFLEGIHIFESIIAKTLGQTTTKTIEVLNETILTILDKQGENEL